MHRIQSTVARAIVRLDFCSRRWAWLYFIFVLYADLSASRTLKSTKKGKLPILNGIQKF